MAANSRLRTKALFSQDFLTKALKQRIPGKKGFLRIWTDSRSIAAGDLFAAISGEKFDGHDFVYKAFQAGALGAMVTKTQFKDSNLLPSDFVLIKVKDTIEALRTLARAHRKRLKIPIIAVAGSNGKTTTKEWIAFLLSTILGSKNVFKTQKSNNSILGIALSLLQIRNEKLAVIEIGIDEPGWMDQHLEVVQPTCGIITTIAEEHLNRLKNIETIAKEELKLLKYLVKTRGAFAANQDCDWISKSKTPKNTLTYGLQEKSDIEGLFIAPQTLHCFGHSFVQPLPGRHNAQNLLAALTVTRLMIPALSASDLKILSQSVENFQGEPHRSHLVTLKNQVRVFDDCYNANPDSMEKSLQTFSELSHGCTQYVIMGDMLDLGPATADAHRRILNRVAVLGFDEIYLFGENFERAFSNLSAPVNIYAFSNLDDLIQTLKSKLKPHDFIFLKGSRGMKLERVLASLG